LKEEEIEGEQGFLSGKGLTKDNRNIASLTRKLFQLPKNSIDVNKLSVYTPNTRYACSLFAQLRGVYFFICGQRCILRNSEEKRPLDAMVLAMPE
jgi:hypothetical protein